MTDKALPTIQELMAKPSTDIVDSLKGIYEHSAWVAESLVKNDISSIQSITELATAMQQIVDDSSEEQKLALLQAHPDLGAKVAHLQTLTKESQQEQSSAGLHTMNGKEVETFHSQNNQYKDKFQFPFILAVRNASKHTVLSALKGRLPNSYQHEFVAAISQVHKIAWMRLLQIVDTTNSPGFLTCHVLDTANGCPAANMKITLTKLSEPNAGVIIGEFVTNSDGRLEGGPALKGPTFQVGIYEWTFYAGDYFASKGAYTSGQPFLDVIPIRFGIDNPDDHYHVPLLVSPWSFSTYRGS
jgi:2-oxo-4-hydroxy-4-carboxy-5-ureidoimidazoline decarboxylase